MHPEIIVLVRIFECRIQILRAFICGTMSGNVGKDYHHLTSDLIETFQDSILSFLGQNELAEADDGYIRLVFKSSSYLRFF